MVAVFLRLLLLIAVFIGIAMGIGALLPRDYQIEASISIDATADQVFPQVDRIKNWGDWSPWSPEIVEGLQVEYSGNASGPGAVQTWVDARGNGKLWIVETEPNQRIDYKMRFANFPEMNAAFEFKESAGATEVVWTSQGQLPGGPFYGYFGFLFQSGMEQQYNDSLRRLKEIVEKQP